MKLDVNLLHPEVALKLDDSVYLNKTDVLKAMTDYRELFNNIHVNVIDGSSMYYGYNDLNHPIKLSYEDGLIKRIVIITENIDYKRFVGLISYDGHNYSGFQIQDHQPTIQGELTNVLRTIDHEGNIVQGASRTDTGVHALNYYFHFDTKLPIHSTKWFDIFNNHLPKDIKIKKLKEIHPLFHSRYDVIKKTYIYKIKLNESDPFKVNYEWFVKELNVDVLNKNIKQLIGTHDFKSFCKGEPDHTIRTIFDTSVIINGNELTLEFTGNGFLRYMIRIIVKALVNISTGLLDLEISDIIKEKSRLHTKDLAPAGGLYLEEIYY